MNPHDANVARQHSPQALSPLAGQAAANQSIDPANRSTQHGPVLPPGTGKLGMWLFLAALFMLFAASLVAYAVIRITGTLSPEAGTIHMPAILWGSTLAMLASSITMHMALTRIKKNLIGPFKTMMLATLALAVLFLTMQTPGLYQLLTDHYDSMAQQIHIYGLLFVLVLLHAAHILGGLFPLAISTFKAQKNRYSQDKHNPILYLTMYWHFLDGVWIVMFAVFLAMA